MAQRDGVHAHLGLTYPGADLSDDLARGCVLDEDDARIVRVDRSASVDPCPDKPRRGTRCRAARTRTGKRELFLLLVAVRVEEDDLNRAGTRSAGSVCGIAARLHTQRLRRSRPVVARVRRTVGPDVRVAAVRNSGVEPEPVKRELVSEEVPREIEVRII